MTSYIEAEIVSGSKMAFSLSLKRGAQMAGTQLGKRQAQPTHQGPVRVIKSEPYQPDPLPSHQK